MRISVSLESIKSVKKVISWL